MIDLTTIEPGTIGTVIATSAISIVVGYVAKARGWWESRTGTQKRALANDVLTAVEDGQITIQEIKDLINKER